MTQGDLVEHINKESSSGYSHDGKYLYLHDVRMKDIATGKWYDAVEYSDWEEPSKKYVREKSDFLNKFKVVG